MMIQDSAKHFTSSDTAVVRGEALLKIEEMSLHSRIDRLFAKLLTGEWLFAIFCAFTFSPSAWDGTQSLTESHLLAAAVIGGLLALFPAYFVKFHPGEPLTRHVVAIAQALMSALLIHLTGGRIETHFHIFGSLAFLMFYRDWRVLITATSIIAFDHMIRGFYFPVSLYGITSSNSWRWLEHSTWVVFEDIFLIYSCLTGRREMRDICIRQGELELSNERIEIQVSIRTQELADTHSQLDLVRVKSLESARLAAVGEMAGGIAHEINNPLAVITTRSQHTIRALQSNPPRIDEAIKYSKIIETTSERIATIVSGLRTFSRSGDNDNHEKYDLVKMANDTLNLCGEKFRMHGIDIQFKGDSKAVNMIGREVQISQVLLNLLNNSFDAIVDQNDKWIKIELEEEAEFARVIVSDSGPGIADSIVDKIMLPFFTTKSIGKGTGLGLSISKGIVDQHKGSLTVTKNKAFTQFVITLPKDPTKPAPRFAAA